MIKNRLLSTSTILGFSLLAIVSNNQYAQATNGVLTIPACNSQLTVNGTGLSVNIYTDSSDSICPPPAGWNPKLFAWEGRAGAPGTADYEFALGDNGAQLNINGSQPNVIYRDWAASDNGTNLVWRVDYDALTKLATFTIDGQSISYTSTTDLGATTPFNGFSLAAKVLGADSKIVSGVDARLNVNRIESGSAFVTLGGATGSVRADNNPSTPRPGLNQLLISSTSNITLVRGNLRLTWPGSSNPNASSARGRVGFSFEAFDPPVAAAATVPEPSSILGLGGIAALAFGASLKRKLAKKK